ncbi:MAG: type II secretion system F family protein [Pseudomonadota bacterium]|nr:type II secretion system F family protein [Pseudomonadota bacterium]MDO7710412.1 type II secretion system F family protein [Pseudomonadota bacterium]
MAIEFSTPKNTDKLAATPKAYSLFGPKGVGKLDVMLFTEQLSLMLETGNDLNSSLLALAEQNENIAMKTVVLSIANSIQEGNTFAQSLAEHPKVFPLTYVSLVRASEAGGYLHRVLEHIYEMDKQQQELLNTLKSAFTYPAFLLFFSFSVVVFVLLVVFPKFKEMFVNIADQLPATTKVLMWSSDMMLTYWWAIIPICIAILSSIVFWLRSEHGTLLLDHFKLTFPLIRDVFQQAYLIQCLRILGLSLQNGMQLIDAIESAKGVVNNRIFTEFLDNLRENVIEGRTFSSGFIDVDFIPPMLKQMIATGESTGNLPLVMNRVAQQYQKDLANKLNTLSKAIEPIMLIVMGVVVGVLVSSLILPIFKLSRAVH